MSNSYQYAHDSYYCYESSNVLKNKLGICDSKLLEEKERKIAGLRYIELFQNIPKGEMNFNYLLKIHKFLFQDIYTWAGKIRTVDIAKGNMFCNSRFIYSNATEIFNNLKKEHFLQDLSANELSVKIAYYFSEINALHPFREGNGRTQRAYFSILAQRLGYYLDFSEISQDDMIKASSQSFLKNYAQINSIFEKALKRDY